MTFTARIKRKAHALGFDQVGVSQVDAAIEQNQNEKLREWLRRGFHGDMHWMEKTCDKRGNIQKVFSGVRSVVSVAMNYYTEYLPDERKGKGRIARYAWGDDYHDLINSRLRTLSTWIDAEASKEGLNCHCLAYVDTGPILEKAWAQRSGIGWIGKHSNLVSSEYGSWLLLGEVLVSADLEPDAPALDQCGSCRLCIEVCPTDAIPEPYVLDATKCIAYLTIEHRGSIPSMFHSDIGNRIFGCDDCLDICPYNEYVTSTKELAFTPRSYALSPDLEELGDQTELEFQEVFRRSPLKRAKYDGLQRNIKISKNNSK